MLVRMLTIPYIVPVEEKNESIKPLYSSSTVPLTYHTACVTEFSVWQKTLGNVCLRDICV